MARILIVDDQTENVKVLANVLLSQKYEVEFALSGLDALEFVNSFDFDLVLLDVMMPNMDGYEVCQKIRLGERNSQVPIIFLTALNDTDRIVKGFETGAQDYITKPFNQTELLARVNTHLELKSTRDKLQLMNQHLEEEVKKRTLELENANRELVKLDSAKTEFLNTISTEIREPMNNVLNAVHLLKDFADSKTIFNLVSSLDVSVKRLESFSNLALKISELRTKKYQANIRSIDASEFINFCFIVLIPMLNERKITLTLVGFDKPTLFKGDYDLLLTSFQKNIENLLYSIDLDGELTVELKQDAKELYFEFTSVNNSTMPYENVVDSSSENLEITFLQQTSSMHGGTLAIAKAEKGIVGLKIGLPKE
ncbi:MAG: response regulator [Salinivirgaceae bacterium]|jgi:DNA-binding response OmpR family regulator